MSSESWETLKPPSSDARVSLWQDPRTTPFVESGLIPHGAVPPFTARQTFRRPHVEPLPTLTPLERRRLVETFSGAKDGQVIFPRLHLHGLFEKQAQARPEALAVVCGEVQLTYAMLDCRAEEMAARLRALGVKRGDFVGLLLPRSADIYICLLAILKAGAAYVPMDAHYPSERIAYILGDCRVAALITHAALAERHHLNAYPTILIDRLMPAPLLDAAPAPLVSDPAEDLAYVIYTSGSTGRPKGVKISHRNAANLVQAEAQVFAVGPEDRVFQGFSIAFDASVEEVWLAFSAGATLVAATDDLIHSGPALAQKLQALGITVLSCVPTLLAMVQDDIPSLRLLIFGGEDCPAELVRRWARPGRRLINSYGPTEATVVATYAELEPGGRVTIGRPLPNYSVFILGEDLQPVPVGDEGELCIGGEGVAAGYLNRPELDLEKFILNPFAAEVPEHARLYRTGDLVRFNANGHLEFLGRIDTQVKIRGFRVELGEIESCLMEQPGVRAAAAAVREDAPGVKRLVAYVVADGSTSLDVSRCKAALKERLPAYMVPQVIDSLPTLPTLPSGKIDRKSLPAPRQMLSLADGTFVSPRNEWEIILVQAWERAFTPQRISVTDHFFDLGGHSLLASQVVSELRADPRFQRLSVLDVYHYPKLEDLARKIAADTSPHEAAALPEPAQDESRWGWAWQGLGLYLGYATYFCFWLVSYAALYVFGRQDLSFLRAFAWSFGLIVAATLAHLSLPILVKWLVLGRVKEGTYGVRSSYYWRFWLVRNVYAVFSPGALAGTPLLPLYLRLLGANIGKNVYLATDDCFAFDLLAIGDNASLGAEVKLLGYSLRDGKLHIGKIHIGKGCYIGPRSSLQPDTVMEDEAQLGDLSMLPTGGRIGAGQRWAGSPARRVDQTVCDVSTTGDLATTGAFGRALRLACYALGEPLMMLFPLFAGLPLYLLYVNHFATWGLGWMFLSLPLSVAAFTVLLCLMIAAAKWLLVCRVKAGEYALDSWYYVRLWFMNNLIDMSGSLLHTLYATVYLPAWLRLLGMRLGKNAEVSTATNFTPDLVELGDEVFLADDVCLGAPHVHNGRMALGAVKIGKGAFVGNSAVVPGGATFGEESLLGCLSTPAPGLKDLPKDSSWLGSPAILLPQRQQATSFQDKYTFRPPRRLVLLRGFIEFFRVTIPASLYLVFSYGLALFSFFALSHSPLWFGAAPIVCLGEGMAAALIVAAIKWVVMGRYEPTVKPLWNHFVWRSEFINALHESVCETMILPYIVGTTMLSWYFRLFGCNIGRDVILETTNITEFDLVEIGDGASVGLESDLQTHLFEDRVMKVSRVKIGPQASVGESTLILYDTEAKAGVAIDGLSLVMKGEVLPRSTSWQGIPVRSPQGAAINNGP